jgi:hypothetical protein
VSQRQYTLYIFRYDDGLRQFARSAQELRTLVVDQLQMCLLSGRLQWNNDPNFESPSQWAQFMRVNGRYADHFMLELLAVVLNRQIILVPVFAAEVNTAATN